MIKRFLVITFALIAMQMYAQETNFSLRPKIKVEKSFSDKFSLQLDHQTRYFSNLQEFERFVTKLEAKYSISKRWDAGLAYAWLYQHKIDDDFYATRNRYYVYLKYNQDVGNWNFSIREKLESTHYNKYKETPSHSPKNVLLTKVEAAYYIKALSLTPYINGQLRYMVNHPDKNEFNQYRWAVGAEYKINQHVDVGLYYEQRGDLNTDNPYKVRIIGADLSINI